MPRVFQLVQKSKTLFQGEIHQFAKKSDAVRRKISRQFPSKPVVEKRNVTEIGRFEINHRTSTDRRRGRVDQRIDFEENSCLSGHADAFAISETKNLRIVQQLNEDDEVRLDAGEEKKNHRVEIFHPQRVDRPIENQPLPMIDVMVRLRRRSESFFSSKPERITFSAEIGVSCAFAYDRITVAN